MKSTVVALVAACLAGSGLAAPTQAVSSQLSMNDIAGLPKLAGYKGDVPLTAREANDVVGGLANGFVTGQGHGGMRKREAGSKGGSSSGGKDGGFLGPLGGLSDAGQLGHLTDDLDPVSGVLGGALSAGGVLPGVVKGDSAVAEPETPTIPQRRQLDIVSGLLGNFAQGLATGRKMGPVGDVAALPKNVTEIRPGNNSTSGQPAA